MIQFDMLFHPIILFENDLICILITFNELLKTNEGNRGKTIYYHGGVVLNKLVLPCTPRRISYGCQIVQWNHLHPKQYDYHRKN